MKFAVKRGYGSGRRQGRTRSRQFAANDFQTLQGTGHTRRGTLLVFDCAAEKQMASLYQWSQIFASLRTLRLQRVLLSRNSLRFSISFQKRYLGTTIDCGAVNCYVGDMAGRRIEDTSKFCKVAPGPSLPARHFRKLRQLYSIEWW